MLEIGSSLHGPRNLSLLIATQCYLVGRYLLLLLVGRNSSDWNEFKEFAMCIASLKAFLRPPSRPKPPEKCKPSPPERCKPKRPGYCKPKPLESFRPKPPEECRPKPPEECKPKPPEYCMPKSPEECNPEPPPKCCYIKTVELTIVMKAAINY